jgi:hypothetical protein
MSSWQKNTFSTKRIFKVNSPIQHNTIINNTIINNTTINNSIVTKPNYNYILNLEKKDTIIKIIQEYGFSFKTINEKIIPNAMGIGDILFDILHLENNIWPQPLFFNIFYFTNNRFYPNPINALRFRLDLLSDILLNHPKLSKKSVIFYLNPDLNEQYKSTFKYDKLNSFNLQSNFKIPDFDDNEYIVFHTKLRLSTHSNYIVIKNEIKDFCKNFKSKYKIYILGEKKMSITDESINVGITTVYDELLSLKNNNIVIDLSKDNIYEYLDYFNFKRDIGIIKKANHNIHFGIGGQFVFSIFFAKNIIHYYPITDNKDINNLVDNPNLKKYNLFKNIIDFSNYIDCNLGSQLNTSTLKTELDTRTRNDNCLSYISGGRLGDFIFQLGIIHANYLTTGKKGILYISNIGDKFVKGVETAYNDTKEIVLKQNYIEAYKIHEGEKYDINLSSWRDVVFTKELNWIDLFKGHFNINFGIQKWIEFIPINNELTDKILISLSLQRENTHINLKEYLSNYDESKLHFVCLDIDEYTHFVNKTGLNLPYTHCNNLIDLLISINSCKLFIGNFSAPLCVALSQHRECIGIAPTDPKHNIDLVLSKNLSKQWPHFNILY